MKDVAAVIGKNFTVTIGNTKDLNGNAIEKLLVFRRLVKTPPTIIGSDRMLLRMEKFQHVTQHSHHFIDLFKKLQNERQEQLKYNNILLNPIWR